MPIPSNITDLSTTAAANSPTGADTPIEGDNHLRSAYSFIRQLYDGITASGNLTRLELASTASASLGDAMVGVKTTATGSVATTQHEVNERTVFAKALGAVGDGVTDDTAAILAACTSLGALGGSVLITWGMKCLIDNNITVPSNVSLVGPHAFVGSPGTNASAPYGNVGGCLIINSTKTITLSGGSSVTGLLVYRKGMTFPAASPAAFAGTAFTAAGDDVAISRCMGLGFNLFYFSSGFQRPRLSNLDLDNNNGIEITNCADTAYLHTIHQWPFATIAGGAATLAKDTRSGVAIYLHDLVDWGKCTDCFSWGYFRSIRVNNANSVTLSGCGGDNFYSGGPGYANTIAFLVEGTSQDTRINNCQAAAHATTGANINTSAGLITQITNFNVWGGSSHGILVSAGDVEVVGGGFRDVGRIASTTNAASRIFVNCVRSFGITSSAFLATVGTTTFFIGPNNDYGDLAAGAAAITANLSASSIASAATINVSPSDDIISVTGVVGISAIKAGWRGRRLTIVFAGVLTVTHSTATTDSVRLNGAVNFTTTAGGTLTIMHNGTQWFEIGRNA